jgi:hypothetical protein
MKKINILKIFLIILFSFIFSKCFSSKKDTVNVMKKIDISIDSLTDTWSNEPTEFIDLWVNNEHFKYIFDNPNVYFHDVVEYLKAIQNKPKPDLSYYNDTNSIRYLQTFDLKFIIVILSMQNINIDKYLEICQLGYKLYSNKYISLPAFSFTFRGYKNYCNIKRNINNKGVRSFLLSIQKKEATPEKLKKEIKRLL